MSWTIKSQLEYSELTLDYLDGLPTIESGHFDNLKIQEPDVRVWLSRLTLEDGMPYNNQVTVEKLVDGQWKTFDQYPAVELEKKLAKKGSKNGKGTANMSWVIKE